MRAHVDRVDRGLAWRESGTASEGELPVVFLHGLGGTRTSWGAQLRGLADGFRCVAWDMPGYGDSDALVPLTYDGIARRVVDLIDLLDVDQVDVVGLSFGGMHALHTALAFPGRIRRMVLADTSPAFGMDGTTREGWIASRLAVLDAGGRPGDRAEQVIDAITASPLVGRVRDETIDSFGRIGADGFRAAVMCLPDNDVRADLHRIRHDVLVVVGELDQETPPTYAQALHDGLVNSRLEVIDDVGHLSPTEAPGRFNRLVRDFLVA
ncbi:alpha/beta fold hydrolase [Ilumatobacter sp.]|uniref:alpha/beta fold hydrolase n=1 Tax=Ilumatobacter sp. TaxID=1967498 RepID=UPI003C6F214B